MAPLPSSTCTALRTCSRQRLPALTVPSSVAVQRRGRADAKASFESPFAKVDVNKIPSFGGYKSNRGDTTNKMFQYFMVGSFGALTAAGAKSTVQGASGVAKAETAIMPLRDYVGDIVANRVHNRLSREHVSFCRCFGSGQG